MEKTNMTIIRNLSRLLRLFLDRSLVGPAIQAQTPWVKWVYNLMAGGTYNSPYLGKLKIPNYPLATSFLNEDLGRKLNRCVSRANGYLQYQFHRLEKARQAGNSRLYWAIVLGLIRRSTAFHVCFLNRVVKGWYFRRSYEWALNQRSRVWEKCRTLPIDEFPISNQAQITRMYVKKSNGKLRPVGAPSIPDRIYQSGLAYFVTHWTEPRRRTTQHGFRPGRGIWSAWFKLITELLHHDCLIEYDLTSWFNRVPLYKDIVPGLELNYSLEDALKYFDIPEFMRIRLLRLMQCTPTKLPEKLDPLDAEAYWMSPTGAIDRGNQYTDEGAWVGEEYETCGWKDVGPDRPPLPPRKAIRWVRSFSPTTHGGSQGSPLSPVLSGLFLDYVNFDRKIDAVDAVHYADDGIISLKGCGIDYYKRLQSLTREIGSTKLSELPKGTRFWHYNLNTRRKRRQKIYQTFIGLIHIARHAVYMKLPIWKDFDLKTKVKLLWLHQISAARIAIKNGDYARVIPAVEFPPRKCRLLKNHGKWLVKEFTFLGSVYNTEEDTLNGIKVSGLNLKNLWKVVGRTYNVSYPEAWSWKITPNSILWRLLCANTIAGKLKFVEPMIRKELNRLVDPNLLLTKEEKQMITQMSTLSCGLLLRSHRRMNNKKPLSLICEKP